MQGGDKSGPPLLTWKVSSFSSADVLTAQIVSNKDLFYCCCLFSFFFPACMRAGSAFKKTPPALDHRRITDGVSGEMTSCWEQSGSWWALSNTGGWKVSVGEEDANTSLCIKVGARCYIFTISGLHPVFNLAIPPWFSSAWLLLSLGWLFGQLHSAVLMPSKGPCFKVFNWNHAFLVYLSW